MFIVSRIARGLAFTRTPDGQDGKLPHVSRRSLEEHHDRFRRRRSRTTASPKRAAFPPTSRRGGRQGGFHEPGVGGFSTTDSARTVSWRVCWPTCCLQNIFKGLTLRVTSAHHDPAHSWIFARSIAHRRQLNNRLTLFCKWTSYPDADSCYIDRQSDYHTGYGPRTRHPCWVNTRTRAERRFHRERWTLSAARGDVVTTGADHRRLSQRRRQSLLILDMTCQFGSNTG